MNMLNQDRQESTKAILMTVVGQAFAAAGYMLQELPVQHAAGQYRFAKQLDDGLYSYISFQFLLYVDSEWAAGMPSRFQVTLTRTDQPNPAAKSDHTEFVTRDLSTLVVRDFDVSILPSDRHWWTFKTEPELGQALAEAGHLIVGYGIPWLAGELIPPEKSS